jgi:hypothetical protein
MKIRTKHFHGTINALNSATDRLSMQAQIEGQPALDSTWMEIQAIGNILTAIYRDHYEPDDEREVMDATEHQVPDTVQRFRAAAQSLSTQKQTA